MHARSDERYHEPGRPLLSPEEAPPARFRAQASLLAPLQVSRRADDVGSSSGLLRIRQPDTVAPTSHNLLFSGDAVMSFLLIAPSRIEIVRTGDEVIPGPSARLGRRLAFRSDARRIWAEATRATERARETEPQMPDEDLSYPEVPTVPAGRRFRR